LAPLPGFVSLPGFRFKNEAARFGIWIQTVDPFLQEQSALMIFNSRQGLLLAAADCFYLEWLFHDEPS